MSPVRNRNRFAFLKKTAFPAPPSLDGFSGRAQFDWPTPAKVKVLLEGFCPEPKQAEWIVVNAGNRMLCLRLSDIAWVRAADDGVELRVGERTHQLRDTLAAWRARLPARRFVRVSDSLIVNLTQIRQSESTASLGSPRRNRASAAPSG